MSHRSTGRFAPVRLLLVCLLFVGACKRSHEHAAESSARTVAGQATRAASVPALTSDSRHNESNLREVSATNLVQRAQPSASDAHLLDYERLTLNGAGLDTPLPWIVAFHGLGDSPRGFAVLFEGLTIRAHVYLVRAPLPYGAGYDWFGTRVAGDPERLALAIRRRLDEIASLIDALSLQPHNEGDAVVTGFSQGGVLSFAVAAAGLRNVRATVPIAGWLPPSLAGSGAALPVYAFHGEEDRVVPFDATQRMVNSWKQAGIRVEYRTYPGVAHSIDARMHRDWQAHLAELIR